MEISNRNPDEVTTGNAAGTDLPRGGSRNDAESGTGEINSGKEGGSPKAGDKESTGIGEINDALEEGTEIKPGTDTKNETAGIP